MSKNKVKYDSDDALDENEISAEEYVKNLTLDDYLNNKKTRDILIDEQQYQYDINLRNKISRLYYDLNCQFNDIIFLRNDPDNIGGDAFADFVYNFISTKHNLNIFQKDPEWTVTLFK